MSFRKNSPSLSDGGSYNFSKSNASSSIVGTSFISTKTQKVHGVEITSEIVWKNWYVKEKNNIGIYNINHGNRR